MEIINQSHQKKQHMYAIILGFEYQYTSPKGYSSDHEHSACGDRSVSTATAEGVCDTTERTFTHRQYGGISDD